MSSQNGALAKQNHFGNGDVRRAHGGQGFQQGLMPFASDELTTMPMTFVRGDVEGFSETSSGGCDRGGTAGVDGAEHAVNLVGRNPSDRSTWRMPSEMVTTLS